MATFCAFIHKVSDGYNSLCVPLGSKQHIKSVLNLCSCMCQPICYHILSECATGTYRMLVSHTGVGLF